jgi:hypothetical protein
MARLPSGQPRFRYAKAKENSAMTQFPKLRRVHACHDRHSAMVVGDEPGRYRPYAHIPACENSMATNALADLFAAAPRLLTLLNEAEDCWGGEFASGDPVDGGDLVEWFGQWLPTVRIATAAAQGQETGAADEATVPERQ